MRTRVIAVIIIFLVLVGFVWWRYAQTQPPAATALNSQTAQQPAATDQGMPDNGVVPSAPQPVTVTYDGSSFSPASVTIPVGGTVNWVDTSGTMWVASDPHPVHTGYDGTSRSQHCAAGYAGPAPFDECAAGTSYSFTFAKAGTWGYHDHQNHSATATVVVQ